MWIAVRGLSVAPWRGESGNRQCATLVNQRDDLVDDGMDVALALKHVLCGVRQVW